MINVEARIFNYFRLFGKLGHPNGNWDILQLALKMCFLQICSSLMSYIESRISNYIVRQVFWEMRIRLDT